MGEFVGYTMVDEQAEIETVGEEVTEAVETEAQAEVEAEEVDEIVVSIGDESPPSEDEEVHSAPEWVKELRKQYRELKRENGELKAKVQAPAETKPAELGKKPALEDFDYDAERYEQELSSWFERKREHDARQAEIQREQENAQKEWQAKLDGYNKAKSELKVKDYDEAEMLAQETFNVTQQGIVLQGAENPALLIYALGKNPAKAKEIAAINDPVKFAFAVAKLEKELKVSNRKAPPPEKTVAGNGSISAAVTGSNLDRLKAKAQQTGDWDEYFAAKRKIKS